MNTALKCKVNYIGFVFYPNSPRNISINQSRELLQSRNKNTKIVALTVDPNDDFLLEIKNEIKPDYIQLHGSETKDRITEIQNMGFKIIKSIKVKDEQDIEKHKEFDNADIILFDTPGMEKSFKFPENLITKLPIGTKYALAGSISGCHFRISIRRVFASKY